MAMSSIISREFFSILQHDATCLAHRWCADGLIGHVSTAMQLVRRLLSSHALSRPAWSVMGEVAHWVGTALLRALATTIVISKSSNRFLWEARLSFTLCL
jgi:hypothetical protein